MKHIFTYPRIALGLLALLTAATAGAQEQEQTLVLRQEVDQPVASLSVKGMHSVSVVLDTADYFQVVTSGRLSDADSLRQPLQSMKLAGHALTIPANFSYPNGISVHTTARRLQIETLDDSHVWLVGAGDTLRLEFLSLDAKGHSTLLVPQPVVVDQAVLRSDDYAMLRHRAIVSPDLQRVSLGESRVEQMGLDDQEEAFRFQLSPRIHRLFGGYSMGVTGWSQAPFGGMTAPMDDYAMNVSIPTSFFVTLGWNVHRTQHWDFGIGLAVTAETYRFPQLMGTTLDPATGLTHFGPVDEPGYYNSPSFAGTTRVWRSKFACGFYSLPLRVEWHKRMDYKGLRVSVEVLPGIQFPGKIMLSEGTWTSGSEADEGRVDVLVDTIDNLFNRLRCDLRFDIGWGHATFFVQGALIPLFRTARKDDDTPTLDTHIYPLTMGFSFSY